MTKHAIVALFVLGLLSVASAASADETTGKVTVMNAVVVVGTRVRPSVSIEVTRAKPEIKLADLTDPKVEQIMRAAAKAPF